MEKIDVVNEQGDKTGEVVFKDEVHKRGLWHRTAHIWVLNSKGELLIQRRAPQKESNPNLWGVASVAGHIAAGDDAVTTAIREAKEELGLDIEKGELEYLFTTPHQMVLNSGAYISNHIDDTFLVERDVTIEQLTLQEEEVAEAQLIPFERLEELINQKHPDFVQHEEYPKLFAILRSR